MQRVNVASWIKLFCPITPLVTPVPQARTTTSGLNHPIIRASPDESSTAVVTLYSRITTGNFHLTHLSWTVGEYKVIDISPSAYIELKQEFILPFHRYTLWYASKCQKYWMLYGHIVNTFEHITCLCIHDFYRSMQIRPVVHHREHFSFRVLS